MSREDQTVSWQDQILRELQEIRKVHRIDNAALILKIDTALLRIGVTEKDVAVNKTKIATFTASIASVVAFVTARLVSSWRDGV